MNLSKNWVLQIDSVVPKALKKFPQRDVLAIAEAVHLLSQNPFLGDIQKMKGQEHAWRRRVGSYRIFYRLYPDQKTIVVFHVERRSSNTYR